MKTRQRSPGACRSPNRKRLRNRSPSGSRREAPGGDEDRRFVALPLPLGERLDFSELPPRRRQAVVDGRRGCFSSAGNLPNRFLVDPLRRLAVGAGVYRAAVEEGAALDGKRVVMNIA